MLKSRFWIDKGGKNFIGYGKIKLLEKVKELGSINAAAKALGMSYKTAWERIEMMNSLSDSPIVLKIGNGSRISEEGEKIIQNFHTIEAEQNAFLSQFDDNMERVSYLSMLGVANQFAAIIYGISNDDFFFCLELHIRKNIIFFADIDKKSCERLNLGVGDKIIAGLKTNSIKISREKIKVKNYFRCEIIRIKNGQNSFEITLGASNLEFITCIKKDEFDDFEVGDKVFAYFDPSDVIVGK